jgi:hypothetical protein
VKINDVNQFGFKSKSSCAHAIWCINEAIRITKKRDLKLFIISIDASKAFDKVN